MSRPLTRWNRPWLWLPPKLAHDLSPWALPLLAVLNGAGPVRWRPRVWRNLKFTNPLGIAGGLDKTGSSLPAWESLGVGFLEVGTVTPQPQEANPGQILDRDVKAQALWNKMGFPNGGVEALARRLSEQKRQVPLFINVGKNRWTANEEAHQDYAKCISQLSHLADAFVINLSSPNTTGLRDLLGEKELISFLSQLHESLAGLSLQQPLLLKLSPDMDDQTLRMALQTSAQFVDGWILTNTTKQRWPEMRFPAESGGVSGRPLQEASRRALRIGAELKSVHPEKLLISVGGVDSAEEVVERLEMGADLVQLYSALVFHGPWLIGRILKELQLLESDA